MQSNYPQVYKPLQMRFIQSQIITLATILPLMMMAIPGQADILLLTNHLAPMMGLLRQPPVIQPYLQANQTLDIRWCTQIFFTDHHELLVSSKTNRLLYRKRGEDLFHPSPLTLNSPHALAYQQATGLFYLCDTDNNRILIFDSPETGIIEREITSIAGIPLQRPHDIVFNQVENTFYTLNPDTSIVLRFSADLQQTAALDLSHQLGYSRALTIHNGTVYVVGSSHGKVVEINDFKAGAITLYQSAGKKSNAPYGNWEKTGLVINDIAFFKGYWYASSYFCLEPSFGGEDYNKNKLIRFRSWKEFETGIWQDLSKQVPGGLVPYYFTVTREKLYLSLYNHEIPGRGDGILSLSPLP